MSLSLSILSLTDRAFTGVLAAGGNPIDHVVDKDIHHFAGTNIALSAVSLVVGAVLIFFVLLIAAKQIETGPASMGTDRYVTKGRLAQLIEVIVQGLRDGVIEPLLGKETTARFLPFLLTVFFFVLTLNLFGMIPFMDIQELIFTLMGSHHEVKTGHTAVFFGGTATASIAVTAGLATLSFFAILYQGFRDLGPKGFFEHMAGGKELLYGPLMLKLVVPIMLVVGALFGMVWAAIPAYLQAYRGSHVVITTIMFNFIASSLLVYLLVNRLRPAGAMAVETPPFAASARLPSMQALLGGLGLDWPASPLNISLFLALLCALGVYLYLWHTRSGYQLRAVGSSPGAAEYAGISARRQIMIGMSVSGGLAGLVGMNEIAGVNGKLLLEYVSGAGFTGIAVSLMGRSHPLGIVLASLLFGALFQGGAEVAFEVRGFSRDMVVMLQGFIVLFSGAMVYVIAPLLARVLAMLTPSRRPSPESSEASRG